MFEEKSAHTEFAKLLNLGVSQKLSGHGEYTRVAQRADNRRVQLGYRCAALFQKRFELLGTPFRNLHGHDPAYQPVFEVVSIEERSAAEDELTTQVCQDLAKGV